MKKSRTFFFASDEVDEKTGKVWLDEPRIIAALAHKTIKRWAYIKHDKDVYNEDDEKRNPEHKAGMPKKPHWHIAIEMGTNMASTDTIAKWFGLAENMIDIPKGRAPFMDCVEYLTHESDTEQAKGKYRYSDSEVKANFDFRTVLQERAEMAAKYGRDITPKEKQRIDVLKHGKTLRQCKADDILLYIEDMDRLKKLRMEYIRNMPVPKVRLNFYLEGNGGQGKGLMSRALARQMARLVLGYTDDSLTDEDLYFEVGAGQVTFEGYDGQPVIIWTDYRAYELLQALGNRGNVFKVFDMFPQDRPKEHVKYDFVALANAVNIVNSVQPFREFLDGLAGEYTDRSGEQHTSEDRSQSYRRFPIIIPIREEDFDLYLNKGVMYDTRDYTEYVALKGIRGSMRRIAELCAGDDVLRHEIEAKTVKPVMLEAEKMLAKGQTATDADKVREITSDYGTYVPVYRNVEPDERELLRQYRDGRMGATEYNARLNALKAKGEDSPYVERENKEDD